MTGTPNPASFGARVSAWQRDHGRHGLPWQGTRDPYRIWVSEIMLQQTQVAAVIPFYLRFTQRFPTVQTLAAAPAADVMAAWAGLGYYSRARNLHRCAGVVVGHHGGCFPRSSAALAKLPGIGRSTAAAIAAFAYGECAAILDGNVKRVLARYCGIDGDPGTAPVQNRLWSAAAAVLPDTNIEAYTQGLMDIGATVCARRRPRCGDCPVSATCVARVQGRTDELPAPRIKRARPLRHATIAIIRDDSGALLLETRPPSGIWGGLMSLPEFDASTADGDLKASIAKRYALDVELGEHLPDVRHEFSHYSLVMQPRLAQVQRAIGVAAAGAHLVDHRALGDAALPAPIRRLLLQLTAD